MKKILISIGIILILLVAFVAINLFTFAKSSAEISKGTPIPENLDENPAILVIDLQEATTGSLAMKHEYQNKASSLYFAVNAIIDSAVARDIPVIYIRNEISNSMINLLNSSMKKGTKGTEFDPRLNIVSDNIFGKEKQDAFSNPELDRFLAENKINKLYITGIDAAYCVRSTTLAALNRKYIVVMISDAIVSESDELKRSSFDELKKGGAVFINSENF